MRFFKAVLPNINISFAVALIVVTILNEFNPMMGFLQGRPAAVLIVISSVLTIINGIVLYSSWRKSRKE